MTDNRRNYYRVLHVQPEAPLEVIRASYRTLMSTLRQHPDLGGDTAVAALLNEAYAVLRDPQQRARYDATLVPRRRLMPTRTGTRAGQGSPAPMPRAARTPAPESAPEVLGLACPVCAADLPAQIRRDTRCAQCDAPLAPPPAADQAAKELFGRRGSARHDRNHPATMSVGWPAIHVPVRWRNLSLTGLSVQAGLVLSPRQIVRIACPALDVLARVVSCRPDGAVFTVHARLLTVVFIRPTGVFLSEKA